MSRKLTVIALLLCAAMLFSAGSASACDWVCCYPVCCIPYYPPCCIWPCHCSCWGKAYRDPAKQDPNDFIWVYFPWCPPPNYLARHYDCWTLEGGQWKFLQQALVFWVDWSSCGWAAPTPARRTAAQAPSSAVATIVVTLPRRRTRRER